MLTVSNFLSIHVFSGAFVRALPSPCVVPCQFLLIVWIPFCRVLTWFHCIGSSCLGVTRPPSTRVSPFAIRRPSVPQTPSPFPPEPTGSSSGITGRKTRSWSDTEIPFLTSLHNRTEMNQSDLFFFFLFLCLAYEQKTTPHGVCLPVRARRESLQAPIQHEQE